MLPLPTNVVDQDHHVGDGGHVRRYSTCERHVERVVPTGYPRGRSYALCTTVVAARGNCGHYKSNRACELLRAVRLVLKGGKAA